MPTSPVILRHQDEAPKEPSVCGNRYRLLSKGDENVAAWAHAVDIDGAKPHYHKRATELYYVLEGEGQVVLDAETRDVRPGTMQRVPCIGRLRQAVIPAVPRRLSAVRCHGTLPRVGQRPRDRHKRGARTCGR